LVFKVAALQVLFVLSSFGQNCLKYGAPTTLSGTLSLRDEAGYNQFIVLKLVRPICTVTDPKGLANPSDEYYRRQNGVKEIQAVVYGSDTASTKLRDRLERLLGNRVIIKGDLFPATTGYHRTNVELRVLAVDAVDAAGQQALLAATVPFRAREVAAYDVTINAGQRLVIEARETGSASLLLPADQYAPHWMTGGEVVYVNCRDGYERKLISTTEKERGICSDEDLCGLSAFPKKPVIIKFRCIRKP
jgi:hypothetical protein